jgi:hypothetical protein
LIAKSRPSTSKQRRASAHPLRRVNIDRLVPPDLSFIQVERLAPLFVLVNNGEEIGRIRGYPGEDHFWGLLSALLKKLDAAATGEQGQQKSLRPDG